MWLTLLDFKIADDKLAELMNVRFLELLPTRTLLFPFAKEILQYLFDKNYSLHLLTNGFEKTQHSKLKYSGLSAFFTQVITSRVLIALKPQKEIFEFAFQKTGASPEESIMIERYYRCGWHTRGGECRYRLGSCESLNKRTRSRN